MGTSVPGEAAAEMKQEYPRVTFQPKIRFIYFFKTILLPRSRKAERFIHAQGLVVVSK